MSVSTCNLNWLFPYQGFDQYWRVLHLDFGVADTKFTKLIASHRVRKVGWGKKHRVTLAAGYHCDLYVIGAFLWEPVLLLAACKPLPESELSMAVITP